MRRININDLLISEPGGAKEFVAKHNRLVRLVVCASDNREGDDSQKPENVWELMLKELESFKSWYVLGNWTLFNVEGFILKYHANTDDDIFAGLKLSVTTFVEGMIIDLSCDRCHGVLAEDDDDHCYNCRYSEAIAGGLKGICDIDLFKQVDLLISRSGYKLG